MIPVAVPIAVPAKRIGVRMNSIKIEKQAKEFGRADNVVARAVIKRENFYGRKIVAAVRAFAPYDTGELSRGGRYKVGEPKHGEYVLHAYVERDPGPYPRKHRPDHAKYYVPMAINYGRRDRPQTRVNPPRFWNRAITHTHAKGWAGLRNGIQAAAASAMRKFAKETGYDVRYD